MITQFGYITIWSLVWPLAPIFALINNYVELRADAVKICKHVRRPVGDHYTSPFGPTLKSSFSIALLLLRIANIIE
jgi:hypothetical protein